MTFELAHGKDNPRNSEGSFVRLGDGRILLVYTRYCGNSWGDHAEADLVSRISSDGGETWSDWKTVVKNDAMNVMSVSLLQLADGRIALLYLRKSGIPGMEHGVDGTEHGVDCRPMLRFSSDEGETWTEPLDVTGLPPVYLVVNNDRLIQLKSGRLIIPAANHRLTSTDRHPRAETLFFLSDDGGASWRESKQCAYPPQWLTSGLREPGVVELLDGRVMAWFRTDGGKQYKAFSSDDGETWTAPVPAPEFPSFESPLSMKRNPETGELFAVWDDLDPRWKIVRQDSSWQRTPLVIAKSSDDGKSWHGHTILEDAPDHGFCYIAMLFNGPYLLLEYCCGGGKGSNVLQNSRIRVFKLNAIEG